MYIREYCEGIPVKIKDTDESNKRLCVVAYNEAGFCETQVDLLDLLYFVKNNMPYLLEQLE